MFFGATPADFPCTGLMLSDICQLDTYNKLQHLDAWQCYSARLDSTSTRWAPCDSQ